MYEVQPLSFEAPGAQDISDAVQLFVDRAREVRGDAYTPSADVRRTISGIVSALEGVPLAIELAAARMSWMDETTLAARLSQPFDVLRDGPRDVAARQRAMRDTLEGSWALLSGEERAVIAQCAAFRGGFDLESAESIVELEPSTNAPSMIQVLQSLRDKSLLRVREDARSPTLRLGMFETIRLFAQEKLDASPDLARAYLRHRRAFRDRAIAWRARLDRRDGMAFLQRFAVDLENIYAAHERALAAHDDEGRRDAMHIIDALSGYFAFQGPAERLFAMLDATLGGDPPALVDDRRIFGRLLVTRAITSWRSGRPDAARADLDVALRIAAELGDRMIEGRGVRLLGLIEWQAGKVDGARKLLESAIALLHESGDEVVCARARGDLGRVLSETMGDFEPARALYSQAIAEFRRIGSVHDEGLYRINLALTFHREGRLADARVHYDEALATLRDANAPRWTATALENLALLHQEQGRFAEASACLDEAGALYRSLGDKLNLGSLLGNVAGVAHEQGDLEAAERMYRASIEASRDAGRTTRAALLTGALGASRAARGDLRGAAEALDEATRVLRASGDDLCIAAVEVFRAIFELASAAVATKTECGSLRAQALARREGAVGLARRSDEVRFALRLLDRAMRAAESTIVDDAFAIEVDGQWFRPPQGERVDLAHRDSLRRIVRELARRRARRASPATVEDLSHAGWPDEPISAETGAARVYTALSTLRNLGLRAVLISVRGRHRLADDVRIVGEPGAD